ncbi:MAG: HEAT repeat domain-containing protein [Myxococcota bacterium]
MPTTIREEDRHDLTFGFLGLLALMAAHATLETARDALFLAGLPATDLPWAYLAIAALAIVALRAQQRLLDVVGNRHRLLAASLIGGALVTLGFWFSIRAFGPWSLLAFYVWTGLLATVLVVQFWLLLDESVTVTRAKRIFPLIAAGGVVGAIVGSMMAEILLRLMPPEGLLVAGSSILVVAAALPLLWDRQPNASPIPDPLNTEESFTLRSLLSDRYLAKLFVLVLAATVSVTAVDYIFKSEVAVSVPAENLGSFFARFYLAMNSVGLLVQVLGARWLLQNLGVHRSAAALPVLLFGGTLGFLVGPALLGAVALKSIDGSMRHSLYRTAVEVLYLPLGSARRQRAKTLIDGFGHRGGQALASVVILAAVALGLSTLQIAMLVLVPIGVWLLAIFGTRNQYEEIFRARLRQGVLETRFDLQALDLRSLEVLLNALNSEQDQEVLAAIDLFDVYGRAALLPVLILYHPSKAVRERALQVFSEAQDPRFVPVAIRMLDDEDCDVRAAALRALTAVRPDAALLTEKMREEAPLVEATALIGLMSLGTSELPTLRRELNRRIIQGGEETRSALARAIHDSPSPIFHGALIELAKTDSDAVRIATASAMAVNQDARYLRVLLPWLGKGRLRGAAREVMVALGPIALEHLDAAMRDEATPRKVRRHIPRTISRFRTSEAARLLVQHLEVERDGAVRFKILRGLGRMSSQPGLRLDGNALRRVLARTLVRATQLARWRAVLDARLDQETHSSELLVRALRDKERSALERAFRLMGILHRREDFSLAWRGLDSRDPRVRAAGREILFATLAGEERSAVLALIDDAPSADRANRAASALRVSIPDTSLEESLRAMLHDDSTTLRCIAAHEVAELSLDSLAPDLERIPRDERKPVRESIEHALLLLRNPSGHVHGGSHG